MISLFSRHHSCLCSLKLLQKVLKKYFPYVQSFRQIAGAGIGLEHGLNRHFRFIQDAKNRLHFLGV